MGIDYDSELFVGAHYGDIEITDEELDELVDDDYIIRVSPFYDAPSEDCYFGISVSCKELLEDGGIDKIKSYIIDMNDKFQTTVCTLIHSANIW